VVLSEGYWGKTKENGKGMSGKPGPAVAHMGLLHNFCLGISLLKTIWLNLFTQVDIAELRIYPNGLGTAPWQQMPQGEDCPMAKDLKGSLMGRLIPLCRFCLFTDEGLHYSEGIAHASHKEGMFDPSIAIDFGGKEAKVRWADPERRPWRELTSLLSFIGQAESHFDCIQLRLAMNKAKYQAEAIAIWSGGLRVSSNAGEQYASGLDDVVESLCWLEPSVINEIWFNRFKVEMSELDKLAKALYGCVMGYYKTLLVEGANYAAQATHLFWQLCERHAQALLDGCDQPDSCHQLRRQFADYATQVFNQMCPHQTARQLDAWAKTKPNFVVYLKQETV
jgi:CRISPR system Cascade subunit CasA